MAETWIYSKVSTPERCLQKISDELPRPIGIMIFGADRELKDKIEKLCIKRVPYLIGGEADQQDCGIVIRGEKRQLPSDRNMVVILDETSSCDHSLRHQIVTNLRKIGAESVVGIYAKSSNSELTTPPTADGLEALITVTNIEEEIL